MSINIMQLDDNLLILILDQLRIKDKFKLKLVCKRFYKILNKIISKIDTLNLKQINFCEWTSSKFNELNTLNLTNINQINKLLNKFSRLKKLKLKLYCSHLLDYRQLNSSSTLNLKEFYLLTNCDSIYQQIIYLQIHNVESLTIYCNKFDYLQILSKQISFLNYFKKLKYFSSNFKRIQMINQFPNNLTNETVSDQQLKQKFYQSNYYFNKKVNQPSNTKPNQVIYQQSNLSNVQLRNHTVISLYLSSFSVDSSAHLDLIKSFPRLERLKIFSICEEYLEKFIYYSQNIDYLIIQHLNPNFMNLEFFFQNLTKLKNLKYLNILMHQLKFDFKVRLIITDFLNKFPKSSLKLVINGFDIDDTNDLNKFQYFLNCLPNRIKQFFNLKHVTSDELNFNYYSSPMINKIVSSQVRSLSVKQFIRPNQLKNIAKNLLNLHYLEISDYFGNADELIFALIDSNLTKLKTIKLLRVNIVNAKTFLLLTKLSRDIIHLEIQLLHFLQSNLANSLNDPNICDLNKNMNYQGSTPLNKLILKKHRTNDKDEEKRNQNLINNLYSFVKFEKIQKLILGKFKLTTSLLLYLLENCSNLYLINVDNCINVDNQIIQNAIKKKLNLSPILNNF